MVKAVVMIVMTGIVQQVRKEENLQTSRCHKKNVGIGGIGGNVGSGGIDGISGSAAVAVLPVERGEMVISVFPVVLIALVVLIMGYGVQLRIKTVTEKHKKLESLFRIW